MTKRENFSLILILCLGLVLRLINLNQSLWLDEAITALAVKNNTFLQLISKFAPGDFHPPLYYFVLKLWTSFFGFSEISLRLPSVIFGLATVFLVYKIAKFLFDSKVALVAALFLACNPLAVYYSQEARMYTPAMFFVALAIYFLLTQKWWFLILSLVVSLYIDYVPLLVLPVIFLSLPKKSQLFFPTVTKTLVLTGPLIFLIATQLVNGLSLANSSPLWSKVVGGLDLKSVLLVPTKFIFGRVSLANKIIYGLTVGLVMTIYCWLFLRVKNKLLWTWLVVPLILGIIVSFFLPIFSYFRFIYVLPAFILILAAGSKSKFSIFFVIAVSLLSLIYFNISPQFQRENWRELVHSVQEKPGYILMPSLAQSAPIQYYAPSQQIGDVTTRNFDKQQKVYLVRYVQEIFDPVDNLRSSLLQNGYHKTGEQTFNGLLVWSYSK